MYELAYTYLYLHIQQHIQLYICNIWRVFEMVHSSQCQSGTMNGDIVLRFLWIVLLTCMCCFQVSIGDHVRSAQQWETSGSPDSLIRWNHASLNGQCRHTPLPRKNSADSALTLRCMMICVRCTYHATRYQCRNTPH